MESIDPRKQKRLGPAPIASFEKSFEDNSQGPSPIGLTGNIHKQNMDTNCGGNSDDSATTTVNNKNDNNKGYELKNINPSIIKYDRPKVSPPDPPQHQHPKISVSIPSKKLHDIGKRPPPPPLQCSSIDDRGGGGGDGDGSSVGSNIKSGKVKLINTLGLNTPLTPRIDISRASSSSQHGDSRDSSPENVFEQVGTGTLQEAIGLGFREEGAFDLKSSTEELYFMDPEQKKEEKEKMQQARKSPIIFKFDDHQTYLQQHQRKDSASSEVAALLCISGRTSRISSVGSQGSAVSRLSAISGVSGISRSPSPHRMLLETSFCGPKPLENIVDGSNINSTEPNTSETLEQVLLSRKHDQTSVVLAEGIKIESSPKRKMLANGGAKKKTLSHEKATSADYNLIKPAPKTTGLNLSSRKSNVSSGRRGSGKQVIGVTESGTKYIRINLKPDHLYPDKGIAPNEKIIEVSSGGPGTTSISNSSSSSKIQDKPSTLHINRDAGGGSDRLTPSSSPKPARHIALVRETGIAVPGNGGDSRSPSPGNVLRKSSFCSLFKTAKDSPDSPRDRSRSKSRDLITPQSQSGTPNKQKSVLAIFKPKRSGSKSKCSSPIDQDAITAQQLDGLAQVEFKFNSEFVQEQDRSRPASRLRYYDTPLDGKSIHIPLHTPPEEKDLNKILPGHQEIKFQEQPPTSEPAPGPSGTKPTVTSPSFEATSVTIINRPEIRSIMKEAPPALPVKSPKPLQLEKIQRIENLDAIQTLPQDVKEKERTWSLEVQRHSSQDSQDTVISANGSSGNNSRKPKTNLDNVIESPIKENGLIKHPQVPPPPPPPKVINVQKVTVQQSQQQQQLQQQPPQPIQSSDIISKEKKRILFATRIGSGSQEQIFSTQFSLSKTESLSSQLSEQISIPESPAEAREAALHRSDTVIRRPEELKKKDSIDDQKVQDNNHSSVELSKTNNSADERSRKSKSSEDEDKCPIVVMMRRKDSSEESRRKSKSASEEDDATHRHSKYLENFDVRKQRFQDNQKRQSNNHNSSDSSIKESNSRDESEPPPPPKIPPKPIKPPPSVSPLLPPPPPASDRQSVTSTDDPAESSESERDSESSKIAMDPNRIKRHLPRHIGVIEDHESTGLVSQESFDDELPYVPTTLPEERPQGVALIPMKERAHMEMKTFSLDRPRSTTPLNPTHLEEYCGNVTPDDPNEHGLVRGEKLRISLPRKDSNINKNHAQKSKSPRRPSNSSGKSWFEFAEQGIRGTSGGTTNTTSSTATITTPTQSGDDIQQDFKQQDDNSSPPPPPLPPRKPSSTSISSGQWINFENIPEKRKAPKRITALPKDTSVLVGQDAGNKAQEPIHYNYVKPEECQCECHEVERESNSTQKLITNVDLLQQGGGSGGGEDMQPLLDSDCHEGIYPSDSSQDYDYNVDDHQSSDERRRYEIDTPSSMRNSRSNRSSGLSDDHDTSPDQKSSLRTTKRSNNSTRNQ